MTINAVLLAVLAVFVQALVPHKFIGWGLMVVYIVATVALSTARLRAQPLHLRRHDRRCRCRT